jgi:8-oxo-dGTP pyrophosphatase MutT (NUDIX family)
MDPITIKVGALIEHEGKLLLIREWSNKKNGHFWNIIKGTLDKPEEGLLACVSRECLEEAGIQVAITGIIDLSYSSKALRMQVNFLGNLLPGSPESIPSQKEQLERGEDIIEKKWFSRDELLGIREEEFINTRAYHAIHSWLDGIVFPLSFLSEGD